MLKRPRVGRRRLETAENRKFGFLGLAGSSLDLTKRAAPRHPLRGGEGVPPPPACISAMLAHCGPHAVDVVVFVEAFQKLRHLGLLGFRQFGKVFGQVTHFAGHDGPAVGSQPF